MTTTAAPADNVAESHGIGIEIERKMYSAESEILNLTDRKLDSFCRFSHLRIEFFLV